MRSNVFVTLLVLLALQFLPGVGVGEAQAQSLLCNSAQSGVARPECPSRQQAYAECKAVADASPSGYSCTTYGAQPYVHYQCYGPQFKICTGATNRYFNVPYSVGPGGCPVGEWNETSKTCHDSAACLSKPPLDGQTFLGAVMVNRLAHEGCEYVPSSDSVSVCLDDGPTPVCISPKKWRPSGNAASPGDPAPTTNPSDATCADAGGGMTMCVKQNGNHCYSASTGRRICWRPGETGEKVDGPVLQKRIAGPMVGPTVGTPGRTPPYGAMYEPAEAGVEVMTEYGWFRDEGEGQAPTPGTPMQMTTTTQNFSTTNNVNAGGSDPDQGENADGTQGSTPGNQGPGGQGGGTAGDANGNGQPDWTEGEGPGVPGEGEGDPGDAPGPPSSVGVGTGLLDTGGLIGGPATCPELGVLDFGQFGEFDMSSEPAWCQLVAIMRAIVLLMAAFTAVKILMGID